MMLTDKNVETLLNSPKKLNLFFEDLFQKPKQKFGHTEFEFDFFDESDIKFGLKLRINNSNKSNFSAILGFYSDGNNYNILTRYNGNSHWHKNLLHNSPDFKDFHIHIVKEEYVQSPKIRRNESYAEPTDRYDNFRSATICLIKDCNITLKGEIEPELFNE